MFSKEESLYINIIKYDTQLKLDYKKLNDNEIVQTNNSVFLVNDEILAHDIALKINSSQKETDKTFISTLLISDTTKLVPKSKSSNLKDCEVSHFNSDYDIAVLKTTLFETKHYFEKTGIDYIYSAFHILNLHIEQNICKNQLVTFLFNNRAFILILDEMGSIVFNKTVDLPTFESIKKSHFYEDDIFCQKLYDEIYYLELNKIIHETLAKFYEEKSDIFVNKVSILYAIKQLSNEQIESLKDELLLNIDYHPINIDEEIFELSKNKHQKQSFIKPRKKKVKSKFFTNLFIFVFFLVLFFGLYELYKYIKTSKVEIPKESITKNIALPNHVSLNDKIEKRMKTILDLMPYDVVLNEFKIDDDNLFLKGYFLKNDTYIKSLKPELDKFYKETTLKIEDNLAKVKILGSVSAKDFKELSDIVYKKYEDKYITDEFFPISRVTEQLKILMPENTIIKFRNSKNDEVTKFNYRINILAKSPSEFFKIIDTLNNELYSINISYPINILKVQDNLEIEFGLTFNQPR